VVSGADVPFGVLMMNNHVLGSKLPKNRNLGAWIGISNQIKPKIKSSSTKHRINIKFDRLMWPNENRLCRCSNMMMQQFPSWISKCYYTRHTSQLDTVNEQNQQILICTLYQTFLSTMVCVFVFTYAALQQTFLGYYELNYAYIRDSLTLIFLHIPKPYRYTYYAPITPSPAFIVRPRTFRPRSLHAPRINTSHSTSQFTISHFRTSQFAFAHAP